jgi:esterase FrsA
MPDILGNALGFSAAPSRQDVASARPPFNRSALLDQDTNCPMLVINGADDVHVPQQDTLVFEGRRDTEVHLIPGAGHCTKSKLPETIPLMTTWLHNLLSATKPSAEA